MDVPRLRKRSAIGPAAVVAAVVLIVTACTGGASPAASGSAPAATSPAASASANASPTASGSQSALNFPPGTKIAHSFCYLNNEGMQIYNNSTIAASQKLGFTIIPSVESGSNPAQQLTDINNMIAQGANILAIQPCDSSAIVPGVKAAADAGIAVIMTDIGAVAGKAVTVVADEVQAGLLSCQGMIDALKEQHNGTASGKVVQIQGEITSDAAQGRTKGFEDCMKQNAPDVTIITVPAPLWDPTAGVNGLQTTLGANPDIVGVYLQSDTQFWTGTKEVLQAAGKLHKRGEEGHVVVDGVDGGTAILQGIRDGYADRDTSQPKTTYFIIGLPFVQLLLEGKSLADINPADYAPLVIEKNAEGGITVKAPNILVTPDTASDKTLWGNSTCSSDVTACPVP